MIQWRADCGGILVFALLFSSFLSPLMAHSPESPEVCEMVDRAMTGLTNLRDLYGERGRTAIPLIALPFVKANEPEHPHVKTAIGVARQIVFGPLAMQNDGHAPTYASSLADLSDGTRPAQYRPEIEALLHSIQDSQGGFGYHPIDPRSWDRRMQSGVALGLSAAGSASLYIGSELLGLRHGMPMQHCEADLPPALRLINDDSVPAAYGGDGMERVV